MLTWSQRNCPMISRRRTWSSVNLKRTSRLLCVKKRFWRVRLSSDSATGVEPVKDQDKMEKENMGSPTRGKQCSSCHKGHGIEVCKLMKQKSHKEKLDFLKSKGLCFRCLSQGELSNGCQQKLTCRIWLLKHPTILHIVNKKPTPTAGDSEISQSDLFISADTETCGVLGPARQTACFQSFSQSELCERQQNSWNIYVLGSWQYGHILYWRTEAGLEGDRKKGQHLS